MHRHDRGLVARLGAEALRQPEPDPRMPAGLLSRRDAPIHEVLVQDMAKAKTRGDRAIRPGGVAPRLEHLPVLRQRRAPGLHRVLGARQARGDRCRGKLDADHTRDGEQRLVRGTPLRQLVRQQRLECGGDQRGDRRDRAPQGPSAWPLLHHLATEEFVHDSAHEEGVALGALMQHRRQGCGQPGVTQNAPGGRP